MSVSPDTKFEEIAQQYATKQPVKFCFGNVRLILEAYVIHFNTLQELIDFSQAMKCKLILSFQECDLPMMEVSLIVENNIEDAKAFKTPIDKVEFTAIIEEEDGKDV